MNHVAQSPRRYQTTSSSVQFLAGPGVVDDLGDELDDLHRSVKTPVTARRTWLCAWLGAYAPTDAWGVSVRDAASGRLDGVALFATRDHGDWDEIIPLGRRQQDRGWLPARSPEAAQALGMAIAGRLQSRDRPWTLRLGQLPAGDPVVGGIAETVGEARALPGVPIPKVEFGAADSIDEWVGKGLRKQLRKARNRIAQDGVEIAIEFDDDHAMIAALLVEVEHTHRSREQHARRASDLDSSPGLRFWRTVILDHAAKGEVEIASLRLDRSLAAYVVSLLDGSSYRVFDGRFATLWARYSPGRLLETAVLERSLADPRFERVDWMNGCASEKLLAANAVDLTEHLVASSPGMTVDLDVVGQAPVAVDHRTETNLASGAR